MASDAPCLPVNLEHIKMIVVSSYALLLNTESPEPHTRWGRAGRYTRVSAP